MKATAFLIFFTGALITLDVGATTRDEREGRWRATDVKEDVPPPRPSFPLLTLPSFSSFSLPGLNIPYLQAFTSPNRSPAPDRVRATKTEYVEVTRRQTVHPVCYTAYEAKAPCLPYAHSDFQDYEYDNPDMEAVHQAQENFVLNEVRKVIRATPVSQMPSTKAPALPKEEPEESVRTGRYIEFKLRRHDAATETSSKIQGSELLPTLLRQPPPQQQSTEYLTKTVLVTKLEKYTDRRVTATLLAVNCLPADRSIPMCQSYPNPVREAPDRRSDENLSFQANAQNIAASGVLPQNEDSQEVNSEEIKSESESEGQRPEINTEDTLIGEE